MATNSSAVSFQGLSSGIQTDALVSAILAQEGQGLTRLQTRQTANTARSAALSSMKTSMNSLLTSLAVLKDKFNLQTVTSTDTNNTNVTATATSAEAGNYDLNVAQTATKARIASTLNNYTGVSSNTDVLTFTSSTAKTTTGTVAFSIDSASVPGGAVSGSFTIGGTSYTLSGTNGVLTGGVGTPLEGLSVTVAAAGGGSGTLRLAAEPSNLAVADPAQAIFTGQSQASFALRGTDGSITTLALSNNSLNGLRDAINASGAPITASIINTGTGTNRYQLVLSAKETGTGTGDNNTSGVITIAAIANEDGLAATVNPSLGITTGVLTGAGTFQAPAGLSGGLTSDMSGASARDAVFTLNGVQLTRQSNTVSDAADGITFTLKQGGQAGTTTLTVAQDKGAALAGMQDLISKYNALANGYKDASSSTKNADGSIKQNALAGDDTSRTIMRQIKSTLAGASADLSGSSSFQFLANLGVRTLSDGTLTLDSVAFQSAIVKDPAAVKRLFTFAGDSTNSAVTFKSASSKTATGKVSFVITEDSPGVYSGTFNGVAAVAGPGGTLVGTGAYEGLTVTATAAGKGELALSRGAGQAVSDLISTYTAGGTGGLATALKAIDTQNRNLSTQIESVQSLLDRRKKTLQTQFAHMEVLVAQMRAAASGLTGA